MGRGTFLTQSVKKGQLLLAEKAVACALPNESVMGLVFDCKEHKVSKESSEAVAALAVRRGDALPHINSRLRYLYDGTEESMEVPDMGIFRSGVEASLGVTAPLSIARMRRVVKYNAFQVGNDDGSINKVKKIEDEEGQSFMQCYDIEDFRQRCDEAGTGLFVVASFMNHSTDPNIYREFIGHMLFIYAASDMEEGTELFNWYGDDVQQFMCGWDAPA